MPEFIAPVIRNTIAILRAYTPALLAAQNRTPFLEFGQSFSGVITNPPCVFVMPITTGFDSEGDLRHQVHRLNIKFALTGMTPDELTEAAITYMRAIDQALLAATDEDWSASTDADKFLVQRIFIATHDYGPLFEQAGNFAKFPELELIVETTEAA